MPRRTGTNSAVPEKQGGGAMRGVIYARFSSSGQREESIDAQVRFCREYADRHKIDIISVYKDEAISGKESAT